MSWKDRLEPDGKEHFFWDIGEMGGSVCGELIWLDLVFIMKRITMWGMKQCMTPGSVYSFRRLFLSLISLNSLSENGRSQNLVIWDGKRWDFVDDEVIEFKTDYRADMLVKATLWSLQSKKWCLHSSQGKMGRSRNWFCNCYSLLWNVLGL